MSRWPVQTVARTCRGVAAAIRARRKTFWAVAIGVFVLSLLLPVVVLSLARGPFDHITFNPWLSRLPEWLVYGDDPLTAKLRFLSNVALAWVIANNAGGEVEWGFIVDVPALVRFVLTSFLFGAFFALWFFRREQVRRHGWGTQAAQYGGAAGVVTNVFGFTTQACSVMGCGVPVLPVVGLALTGVSSGTLVFLAQLSQVATAVVLLVIALSVAWLGWVVGGTAQER
jgi:hypothetical protein